jgi:hypothetical protein
MSEWRPSNNRETNWKGGQLSGNGGGLAKKGQMPAYTLRTPHHAFTIITENTNPSLVTQGWVGAKPCLVTVDTRAYVTVVRPDIAAGWPERQLNQCFKLQTVSEEVLPILKEVFLTLNLTLTLTLGQRPLKILVFVASITNEFILGLDILCAYDASVDLGHQTLSLAEEEVSLWSPGAGPHPFSLVVVKDQVIPAKCEGILMARLESPLGVESDLVEQSPKAHPPEGIYSART